jgi:hypothetical protein
LFGAGKEKADWSIEINPSGGLTLRRPWPETEERASLAVHAAWRGPVKLRREGNAVVQQIEMFFGPLLSEEQGMALDEEEQTRAQAFLAELLNRIPTWIGGVEGVSGWEPPPAQMMSDWLNAAGHEAAIDQEENLRMALKRRGCDGQIRVERATGRLRFTMLLGEWRDLDAETEQAMLALADEANTRSRLVRIAWLENDENARRCEAQVDLSGLPFDEPLDDAAGTMWKEMVRATVDGLELALRRLGLELNGLAEPANRDLAEACGCGW